ncbi:hypothetical protein ARTHRO9AX_80137 [Arthrobacter sp. 9AX]|nr:hypothetical protein ARTHRO9AX_80137 [Arthrobacter sp. 9AX]
MPWPPPSPTAPGSSCCARPTIPPACRSATTASRPLSAAHVGMRQERQQTVVTYESVLVDSLQLDQTKTANALMAGRLRPLEDHPQLPQTLQALVDNDFSRPKPRGASLCTSTQWPTD